MLWTHSVQTQRERAVGTIQPLPYHRKGHQQNSTRFYPPPPSRFYPPFYLGRGTDLLEPAAGDFLHFLSISKVTTINFWSISGVPTTRFYPPYISAMFG